MSKSDDPTSSTQAPRKIGTLALVMINVVAIDSLRSLPFSASFGWGLITIYLLGLVFFLIPTALVSAQLATHYPNRGGIYIWVREAFGPRMGFIVIWMQWIYNVIWYPTILAFVVATLYQLVEPSWVDNTPIMLASVMASYWLAVFLNLFGMRFSSALSSIGAVIGTLLPMAMIIGLGASWLLGGHVPANPVHHEALLPNLLDATHWPFLMAVIFGLVGIEMSAVHADEVTNPGRAYPRAIAWSATLVFLSLVLSSLAIVCVLPHNQLNILTGLIDAFDAFFTAFGLTHARLVIAGLIIIGGFSSVATWIIGPTKGIYRASVDGLMPSCCQKLNRHGVPVVVLALQGLMFTLASTVFLAMPRFNTGYLLLTDMTSELALIVYMVMFAANLKLMLGEKTGPTEGEQAGPKLASRFTIPGKKIGQWLVCGLGIACCVAVALAGLFPPGGGDVQLYTTIIVTGVSANILLPMILCRGR